MVAQVCVYFACLGVDCEPNTMTKYRSPGGGVIEAVCCAVISAAGVGGVFASEAQPNPAKLHANASVNSMFDRSMVVLT
jgi:hypothetical protein